MVAEEIDDNAPYNSAEEIEICESDEESLLIETEQAIEEDNELKKR